jgi:hypothetical protein
MNSSRFVAYFVGGLARSLLRAEKQAEEAVEAAEVAEDLQQGGDGA